MAGALALALIAAPAALAWQSTVHPPPPVKPVQPNRSLLIVHPTPAEQARHAAHRQHLQNELRSQAVQEKIRRQSAATTRLPYKDQPQLQQQMNAADRAQQRRAQMQQQDLLDRYQRAAAPPPASVKSHPAPARSGG